VRFLVDANLSPRVAEWLRDEGHDAVHVFEVGLNEAGDFGEILARSSKGASVLILRLRSTATTTVSRRLGVALAQAAAALEEGAVVVVGEASLRVRRLPLGG